MRLWSLHPKYLDSQGLVGLWREALLAFKVLKGETRGYRNHPQLERFREQPEVLMGIKTYLSWVWEAGRARNYNFDRNKFYTEPLYESAHMSVTDGQLEFEWNHLMHKLQIRSPGRAELFSTIDTPTPHPSMRVISGPKASWERG